MRRGIQVVALAALWIWPAAASGAGRVQRLEELRREIEAREARAQSYRQEADTLFEELDAIDRQLTETRRSRRRLRQRQLAAEEELELARAGLEEAGAALERTQKALKTRLVALYKFGSRGSVPALYSAGDFQSFSRRREGLARVLAQDAELFDRFRVSAAAWDRKRLEAERLLAEVAGAEREIDKRNQQVRRDSIERHNLVALLRSKSEHESRAAEELRRSAKRLEEAIQNLPSEPSGQGLPRGTLPWPVEGRLRVGFGRQIDPEFGTATRRSGVEIEASRGMPVQAVADGRVLFGGWFQGYGQLVILDHGQDTVSVSGYLEEILVDKGAPVKKGGQIGTVGDTGSLLGPGLYFEIRHQGNPVDPKAWLSAR